tara:strand:- start:70 stop:549 length:480 start_codon:yes stop_codon:yes gene_type:complete
MNQVAEKVELELEHDFDISLVPNDKLTLVWEDCEKHLQKSCSRSNGRALPQDIFYDCLNQKASLWIIFDKDSLDIVGCSITKIVEYPTNKRMLNIDHIGGKKMNEWIDRGLEVINNWAKSNECVGIEGIGREGFWNWIKDRKGWEKTAIFFEYEFKENE